MGKRRRGWVLGATAAMLWGLLAGCGGDAGASGTPGCDGCAAPTDGDAAGASAAAGGGGASGGATPTAGVDGAGVGAGGTAGADGAAGAGASAAGGAGSGAGGGSGAAGGGAGSGAGGGGACVPAWSCSAWSELADGRFERSCVDDNACGDDGARPPEGPVALPALDEPYFRCNVQPIFDWGCAMLGCHGTETGRAFRHYAPGRLRNDEIVTRVGTCIPATGTVNLKEAASGTVMCEGRLPHTAEESRKNFDVARSFMLGVSDPEASELLAQPVVGGKAHAGVHLYRKGDARYQTIRDWLAGASQATCP